MSNEENKKYRANWMKKWRQNNPDIHRQLKKQSEMKARMVVLQHYSNNKLVCACCSENYLMLLSIDHIFNDGGEARRNKLHGSGYSFWRYLIKNNLPSGYQVLCHNCNLGKAMYGICPHTTKDPHRVLNGTNHHQTRH